MGMGETVGGGSGATAWLPPNDQKYEMRADDAGPMVIACHCRAAPLSV
jgi:hypothetical protein